MHRKVNSGTSKSGRCTLAAAGLVALALFAGPLSAKTYRWIDDDGGVVYSQTPPPDDRPTTDLRPPPPPPLSPEQARRQLEERMQQLDDNREDKGLAREKQGKARRKRDEKSRACDAARSNLTNLQRSMNKRILMPDGSYQRFDENERQKRIREAEVSIKENCK